MNNNERELWVRNDEGLYAMWQDSKLSMRVFLTKNGALAYNGRSITSATAELEQRKLLC